MTAALSSFGSPRALLALTALTLFTVWISWQAKTLEIRMTGETRTSDLVGKPAPVVSLTSFDGRAVSLADFRGKQNVVLVFWASWCGPCHIEMPVLKRFYQSAHKDGADFEILAVSIDDNRAAAEADAAASELPFPVLFDISQRVAGAWHVDSIPALFVVDKNGKVAMSHIGADSAVEFLLAGQLGIKAYKPNMNLPDAKPGH
jgi:peroxiredoxin